MSNPMQTHGAPSWLELHTDDVERAKKFYTEVLGWGIKEMEMSGGNTYNALVVGDGTIGGIIPKQAGPTRWLPYVTVDDVEKRTKQAEQSGGKVISAPAQVPGVGTMATIEDPTGAAICFITYAQS